MTWLDNYLYDNNNIIEFHNTFLLKKSSAKNYVIHRYNHLELVCCITSKIIPSNTLNIEGKCKGINVSVVGKLSKFQYIKNVRILIKAFKYFWIATVRG